MTEVKYRKWDSEDMIRVRSHAVVCDDNGKTQLNIGLFQKVAIVLSVSRCLYFTDVVEDGQEMTDDVFNRRMKQEFRRIPINEMDGIFREAAKINKFDTNIGEYEKK